MVWRYVKEWFNTISECCSQKARQENSVIFKLIKEIFFLTFKREKNDFNCCISNTRSTTQKNIKWFQSIFVSFQIEQKMEKGNEINLEIWISITKQKKEIKNPIWIWIMMLIDVLHINHSSFKFSFFEIEIKKTKNKKKKI